MLNAKDFIWKVSPGIIELDKKNHLIIYFRRTFETFWVMADSILFSKKTKKREFPCI